MKTGVHQPKGQTFLCDILDFESYRAVNWQQADPCGNRNQGRESMSTFQWYQRARARVEQFLPDLDRELEVEVEETSITPKRWRRCL